MSSLKLSYSGTPECIQTFVSSLNFLISSWSLSLEELDNQSIRALGNGLQHHHADCLELWVTGSDINEDGMTCLVDGLQNIKSLNLYLSRNSIYRSGLSLLAEQFTTLIIGDLDLSYNSIDPVGATALAGGMI